MPTVTPTSTNAPSPSTILLRILLPLALFGAYPLALFCPIHVGPSLLFYFQLPVFFLFSLAATLWLLAACAQRALNQEGWRSPPGVALLAFAVTTLWCALSAVVNACAIPATAVELRGLFAVPLLAWLHPNVCTKRGLTRLLALLWLIHVAHSLWQVHVNFETVGITGNRNWQGTLTLALLPFIWLTLRDFAANSCGVRKWLAWGGGALATGITLFLLVKADSRAAWLMLLLYPAWLGILQLSWRGRGIALLAVSALLALLLVGPGRDYARRVHEADIRLPLWQGTAQLIATRPMGVGPGNFRREYPPFKPLAHKARAVAAEVTEHPHNEWLRLAAELGLPFAALWLLLWIPLAWVPRNSFARAAHAAVFILVGQGMLDKTLTMPPTGVVALLLLGYLWRERFPVTPALPPVPLPTWARPTGWVLAALAVTWGGWQATRLTASSWWMRQGRLLIHEKNQSRAEYAAFARASQWQPNDVEAQLRAGMTALNGLRNPQLAFPHLEQAWKLEPWFAHVNGELGCALLLLGQPAEAQPLFTADALNFPFSPLAARRLLLCALLNGDLATAETQAARLPELDARLVRLKHPNVAQLASAKDPGDPAQLAELAAAMPLELLDETLPDPLLEQGGGDTLSPADAARWRLFCELRTALPPEPLTPAAVCQQREAAPEPLRHLPLAFWLTAAGFDLLAHQSQTADNDADFWLLARRDAQIWRVDPTMNSVTDWQPAPADATATWLLLVPVQALSRPLELLRNLRQTATPPQATDLPPELASWPSLRRLRWHLELAQRFGTAPSSIPILAAPLDAP